MKRGINQLRGVSRSYAYNMTSHFYNSEVSANHSRWDVEGLSMSNYSNMGYFYIYRNNGSSELYVSESQEYGGIDTIKYSL